METTRPLPMHPVVWLAIGALLVACERPPIESEQTGYRGLAIEQNVNPRLQEAKVAANQVPAPIPPADPEGPLASELYENVQVLGDLRAGEFTRLMAAITTWVSPTQGCLYCHPSGNFADESAYTKKVARRMIQMTQRINGDWKDHVRGTGVTCYTCHRGQPVPANVWVRNPGPRGLGGLLGAKAGQNMPAPQVGLTSLPFDPFSAFLERAEAIRIQSASALPSGDDRASIKDAEWTYGFMIHMSESLGVNCTYCHNSRAFRSWEESSPARLNAWYAIRMVRQLNDDYVGPLANVFPANRKGPEGDPYKVNCATCHQGVPKPLLGVSMLKDYPELGAAHGNM